MTTEFVNNKKIKNTILGITLTQNKDAINKIIYENGLCYNTSNIYPGSLIQKYKPSQITPTILEQTFELLCQFNPQKSYDLYCLIQNKELKDLLITAVRNVYKKYTLFNKKHRNIIYRQNLFKGNAKRDYYDFFINLNTWLASILLEDNTIKKGFYQKIAVSNVPIKSSGQKEYLNPSLDNIIYLSSLICQGDLDEYINLINNINHNSKQYNAIIQGGNLYINKIQSLERQLTKK